MSGITPLIRSAPAAVGAAASPQRPGFAPNWRHAGGLAAATSAAYLVTQDHLRLGRLSRPAAIGLAAVAARQTAALLFQGQADKPKHAAASALVTGIVSHATRNRAYGVAAGVAVGIAKELYDGSRFNPGGSRDFRLNGDLGADLIGIAFGAVM